MNSECQKIISILTKNKEKYQSEYFIKHLGIFGSYLSDRQTKKSDLDLLVDFSKVIDLLAFVELKDNLSDLLGKKVDIVMKSSLKPYIGKHILKEVNYIF